VWSPWAFQDRADLVSAADWRRLMNCMTASQLTDV